MNRLICAPSLRVAEAYAQAGLWKRTDWTPMLEPGSEVLLHGVSGEGKVELHILCPKQMNVTTLEFAKKANQLALSKGIPIVLAVERNPRSTPNPWGPGSPFDDFFRHYAGRTWRATAADQSKYREYMNREREGEPEVNGADGPDPKTRARETIFGFPYTIIDDPIESPDLRNVDTEIAREFLRKEQERRHENVKRRSAEEARRRAETAAERQQRMADELLAALGLGIDEILKKRG